MSLPNHIPLAKRSAVSQRWHEAKAVKRLQREPDFETVRMRALHDAKGKVLREGVTYTASGATNWQVRRSIAGRINQFDLIANNSVVRTCGRRSRSLIRPVRKFQPQHNT